MRDKYVLPLLLAALTASAASVTWDPNTEPDIAGYFVYKGSASRTYTNVTTIPSGPNVQITNTVDVVGIQYIAVTAFNTSGLESDFSNELVITNRPGAPKSLRDVITGQTVWLIKTNNTIPVSWTPTAVVSTVPGSTVSGTISGNGWSLNKASKANTAGNAFIVGKPFTEQSLISLTTVKVVVPVGTVESQLLP